MRLISFVAISFLAITVSAQAPWDSPYQSLQQSDQAEVEQARLTAAYEKEKEIFSPMNKGLKIDMQKIIDLKDKVDLIAARLKETDFDDDDELELELEKEYYDAKAKLDDLVAEYDEKFSDFVKIRTVYDYAKAALDLFLGNQKQIDKHNAKGGVQTGPSPGSCYNLDFLKKQIDTISKKIEDSLKELEIIKANEASLSDDLKARRSRLTVIVRRLGVQRDIAMEILREHEQSQTMGARIMQFFYSYLPNA